MPHVVRTGITATSPHGPEIGTELNQDLSAAMDTAAIKAVILGTGAAPGTQGPREGVGDFSFWEAAHRPLIARRAEPAHLQFQ
jgi:hypothetical protein